jgi:hypothetical protein
LDISKGFNPDRTTNIFNQTIPTVESDRSKAAKFVILSRIEKLERSPMAAAQQLALLGSTQSVPIEVTSRTLG